MVGFNSKNIKINESYLSNSFHNHKYKIEDLLSGVIPVSFIDQEVLNATFSLEIEEILQLETLYTISRAIINLESKLNKIKNILSVDLEIPHFDNFYYSLSPVFLQTFVETKELFEVEELQGHWLEGIKIALEEELTIWQEKIESQKN